MTKIFILIFSCLPLTTAFGLFKALKSGNVEKIKMMKIALVIVSVLNILNMAVYLFIFGI